MQTTSSIVPGSIFSSALEFFATDWDHLGVHVLCGLAFEVSLIRVHMQRRRDLDVAILVFVSWWTRRKWGWKLVLLLINVPWWHTSWSPIYRPIKAYIFHTYLATRCSAPKKSGPNFHFSIENCWCGPPRVSKRKPNGKFGWMSSKDQLSWLLSKVYRNERFTRKTSHLGPVFVFFYAKYVICRQLAYKFRSLRHK
jgi:hypothetical protein